MGREKTKCGQSESSRAKDVVRNNRNRVVKPCGRKPLRAGKRTPISRAFFFCRCRIVTLARKIVKCKIHFVCYSSVAHDELNAIYRKRYARPRKYLSAPQTIGSNTGVNWLLYTVTDWLGLVPIAAALGFAILGLVQFIKRKSLWKVDHSSLALGVFYIVVMAVYVFFEMVVINYRPTLIDGYLEASYPSSTTMLVMCVMPTAAMQLNARIKNTVFRRCAIIAIVAFTAFMVIGRLVSGVHWITDIIGGALFSAGVVTTYFSICNSLK